MTDPWPPWSDDLFLDTLRDAYFPRAKKAVVECEGIRVRTLLRGKSDAVSAFYPFPIYLEPIRGSISTSVVAVPYLADVVTRVSAVGEGGPPGGTPSPFIDWSSFGSFEQYLRDRRPPPGLDSPATIARKARKLRRDFGDFELRLNDDDPDVFETLLNWKNGQYLRTAGHSRLNIRQNVDFYHELRRRGVFTTSSLRASGRLIGGKIGYLSHGRRLSRVTVYDHALRDYSAGSVLEFETLRASFEAGEEEFDFLVGAEPYKFTWATHVRWLGEVGREPVRRRIERRARGLAGSQLRKHPAVYSMARSLESRLTSLRQK